MIVGPITLTVVRRFSKLIALAAAIFLLFANLDSVPDCPELLNGTSKSFVSVSLCHFHAPASLDAIAWGRAFYGSPTTVAVNIAATQPAPARIRIACLFYRSADSSPPLA